MGHRILKMLLAIGAISFLFTIFSAYAEEIVVKKQSPVRSEPRGSSKKLGVAEEGERYTLLSDSPTNKWYHVEYQSQPGWIYSRWIAIENSNPSSTIKIATFNTLRLGQRKDKMIGIVAAIIIRYDVVALEEVMYDSALPELIDSLKSASFQKEGANIEWAYIVSEAIGPKTYKEHYAFVWRKDRVQEKSSSEYVYSDVNNKFDRCNAPYKSRPLSSSIVDKLAWRHHVQG